jgi:hypothetical protein
MTEELSALKSKYDSYTSQLPSHIRKDKLRKTALRGKARKIIQQYRKDNPDAPKLWGSSYPEWCRLYASGKPGITPSQPLTYEEEVSRLHNTFQNGLSARKEARRLARNAHTSPPRWAKEIQPDRLIPLNESLSAKFLRDHCRLVLTTNKYQPIISNPTRKRR